MKSPSEKIIESGHKLYQQNLIVGTEGNLSTRLENQTFLITRSGIAKGSMTPEDLVILGRDGKKIKGNGISSSETPFHLFFYETRPEIGAVIHAHPPYAIACSLTDISFERPLLAETAITLGSIPTIPYQTPTTNELVEAIGECQKKYQIEHNFPVGGPRAFILQRHGAITLGKDLDEAYLYMETLERTAQIAYLSQSLGKGAPLPPKEIERLQKMASKK